MSELVYYDYVSVFDENVFTQARADAWRSYLKNSYNSIFYEFQEIIDNSVPIQFYMNRALLDEVVVDAIIGMRKIVESNNNSVENPNSFKVAAYLSYQWLRHKPVSIYYDRDFDFRDVIVKRELDETEEKFEERCLKCVWDLKHINEVVAVQFVMNYIFDFEQDAICGARQYKHICKKSNYQYFKDFDHMYQTMNKKLLYYFSYRAIAPKIIEQIIEAYTIHPVWELTGNHWGQINSGGEEVEQLCMI